ncbi:MAG TPA: AarF/ABC1/UbiB kinase family protein [Kofleriaceae bacterium]|nr:AarF/ABC1/UbiB kinase family protein [Kofleriaceae bacterium]
MSAWMWLAAAAAAVAVVAAPLRYLLWRAARRRNAAGIQTSGRGLLMGSFMVRRLFRRGWLRVRMALATRQRRKQLHDRAHIKSAQEAAALLGSMKGVFMKMGQIVSFAHDALPEQARAALQGLQQDAPPMSFALVREVIEEELGGGLADRFAHIDEEPLAAASIGQVHRARLRDGGDVVVKVQYPGVDRAIEGDLAALDRMGRLISTLNPAFDAPSLLVELRERIVEELDYRREARNQALFRRLWEGHPYIRVPRVHPEHTGKRVLTQDHVRGFGFYDFVRSANDREKQVASAAIADFVFDSMFCHLVYNGDPHPGNYLFHEDGAVTFIDFGCVKRFSGEGMGRLKRFFRAVLEEDHATFHELVVPLGLVLPGRTWDRERMWAHWRYHLEPYWSGDFVFTEEYLARGRDTMAPKNTRDMNLPPDLLFFTRITFGLNAIAQQLGHRGDFQRSARRHFYVDQDYPSALGLVGIPVPDHFRRLPHSHGPGEIVARVESAGDLPTWPAAS